MLPYALLGYRTTIRTSTGATPYLLVYGTEAVIPAEVEIPSLRIIQEAELSNAEWVRKIIDQLTLIDEKRMVVVCHCQLYRQRMIHAFHRSVRSRVFKVGQLVLKCIFLIKTNTKENSRRICKDPTWLARYYPEVLSSCQRWMALHGRNQLT
ncbi:uncharacterized protein LOC114074724 [Solanum pennellii]|uniref:Uncharacterized protein LOC114074724 n=1 Tax=Solanum pennellii TaxID=28526 RepID=A0ABM1UYF0_SOLPN|nr:uncharacterized protein LOC114074724 [Solanum pennellii]